MKTRRDTDIIEIATANTRSDLNTAVNMETSWGKYLEMLPQFTIKEIEQHRQLTLSRQRPISYRKQSIDLLCKSMDWFLYHIGLHRERVKWKNS